MKLQFLLFSSISILLLSCSKKEEISTSGLNDTTKIIESLNVVRSKINNSIRAKNNKNTFSNLEGVHALSYSSDDTTVKGKVNFKKTGKDFYEISGSATSGQNTLSIEGTIHRVSVKHLNFYGTISQKINGKTYTRNKGITFFDEGKGNFWRLQDKINGSGFVEYIDIYK